MLTPPATDAELADLVMAYLSLPPHRSGILRPRLPYLPHPRRRLPRLRGVRVRSKSWPAWAAW